MHFLPEIFSLIRMSIVTITERAIIMGRAITVGKIRQAVLEMEVTVNGQI